MDDCDITRNKHKGSPESIAAYEKLRRGDQLSAQRKLILEIFRQHLSDGLTAQEAAIETALSYASTSARFSELKKMGLIAPKNERRFTESGCRAAVYTLAV